VKYIKLVMLVFLFSSHLMAEDKDLENIFKKNGINGAVIISSLNNDKKYIYNNSRAEKRYIPASTFKILNTLIALDQKVINNENDIIKWDGKKRFYSPWNQDQTLKSAISISCVWCYQKFARKIGNKNYLNYFNKNHYGNEKTGSELATFWLDGDLKISTYEQIEFLQNLYNNNMAFQQKHMNITKEILTVEKTNTYIIKAKSGWAKKIGWYIGYVETKNDVWFFALNADIERSQLKYRKEIIMNALKLKSII